MTPNVSSPAEKPRSALRHLAFRRILFASLLSNFGLLINGVGAGWAMTELSGKPEKVALVQTALMLPFMLFSIPAGAISDTYDRRKVSMVMLLFAFCSATLLTGVAAAHLLTPGILLVLCFLVGTGNAMFGPPWQASVSEQVPAEDLPQAIAYNSMSYNIARSFGPALGGIIVAAAGAVTAFGITAVCYLPITIAFYMWQRVAEPPRLPPERVGGAIVSGIRYLINAPPMRAVILRSVMTGVAGAALFSLMPLVARDLIGGGPLTYGILLGAFGVGAVSGAFLMPRLRHFPKENVIATSGITLGVAIILLALSRSLWAAMPVLLVAGCCWMQLLTQYNIVIQTQAPRWITGRALASYQAATAGGIAMGAWIWGSVAQHLGTGWGIAASGIAMLLVTAIGRKLRIADPGAVSETEVKQMADPDEILGLTGRSGPILIEIDYSVDPDQARQFYELMQNVGQFRRRNGAYQWSLARDVGDGSAWVERFSCPTWHDYLRQRDRMTARDRLVHELALEVTRTGQVERVRRFLERPTGSVRWRSESRDPGVLVPFSPSSG